MANNEMPVMAASSYAHTHHNLIDANQGLAAQAFGANQMLGGGLQQQLVNQPRPADHRLVRHIKFKEKPMTTRRIVQVFVADTDENVPIDKCVVYSGEQKLTDLTDQELFFEIDIKRLLDQHNAMRVMVINKSVKERTEMLEPARIRDLKMTVVTVATF